MRENTPFPPDGQGESAVKAALYRKHLVRAKDAGNWFLFFRPYYRILPKLTALFLNDLFNRATFGNAVVDADGWMLCTVAFLAGRDWTAKEQETHFAVLKARGYVELTRRGVPPRRWLRVVIERVEADLDRSDPDMPEAVRSKEQGAWMDHYEETP